MLIDKTDSSVQLFVFKQTRIEVNKLEWLFWLIDTIII